MDFFYYNNNNEKIKLNIDVGAKWDSLKVDNQKLNSIFAQVDDGNGEVSNEELTLLQKLFKKADGIFKAADKNNILENEELDEIEKQIEEGKITLSKRNNASGDERVSKETVTHHEHFTKEEAEAIQNNETDVETVRQKYIEKIKTDLKKYHRYDERFPEDRYEIEVKYNGKYYESFVYDKETDTMYQGINDYNGIVDKSDFSEEDLEKLEDSDLLRLLNIDRAQGRMWTPELSKIVSSILHNTDLDEKIITVSLEHWGDKRNIVYDVETKTIKFSDSAGKFGNSNFKKKRFDENGRIIEDYSTSMLTTYKKDGKTYELGFKFISWLAEQEGFPTENKVELTDEERKLYEELANDIDIWDKFKRKYDENGNQIWSESHMQGSDKISTTNWNNGNEDTITTDKNGNFISHHKYTHIENGNERTLVQEDIDEQGNLLSKTTEISTTYEEPKILNQEGNKCTKRDGETKTIKELPDGSIEENIEYYEYEEEELVVNGTEEFEDISFTSEDGTKFDIKAIKGYSSVINITTPSGKTFSLDCEGYKYGDNYYKNQLPVLKDVLNSIPPQVLEDISNEITDIKISEEISENGRYIPNTNTFVYNTSYKNGTMSFVHEIGHAIDNQNGDMWSKNPEFSGKFARLKELANKLINHDRNHALKCAEEYFASTYADMEFPTGLNNHIRELDDLISPFKDSENPEEKELYELHQSLKADVKARVEEVRKQPKSERMDNNVTNIVKTELKDIIERLNEDSYFVNRIFGLHKDESIELEIISTLVSNDDYFNKALEIFEKCSKNEVIGPFDTRLEIPEEAQKAFEELIPKMKEIRKRIKTN